MPRPPCNQDASLDLILQALADCRTELRLEIQRVSDSLSVLLKHGCEQRKDDASTDHASLHKSKSSLTPLDESHKFRRVLSQAWQHDHASQRAHIIAKQATSVELGTIDKQKGVGGEFEPQEEMTPGEIKPKGELDHRQLSDSIASNLHQSFGKPQGFSHALRTNSSMVIQWSYQFVTSTSFEILMTALILLNLIALGMQIQMHGHYIYEQTGLDASVTQASRSTWLYWESFFVVSEYIFTAIYTFELACRIGAYGKGFFKSSFNIVDASVILINCVECVYLAREQDRSGRLKLAVLRVFKAVKIVRLVKLGNYMTSHFKDVDLFVRTFLHSFHSLCCCILLVAVVVAAGAIFLAQISIDFLDDEAIDPATRIWLYDSFGTTDRSLYTLFECTFTSHWWHFARITVEEVQVVYVCFWIPFVIIVNFAMIRIISALFIKQALSIADIDKERAAIAELNKRDLYAKEIKAIFFEADLSNDGLLSKDEWDKMLHNPKVISHFQEMDMELVEVDAVFRICSSDDEVVDFDEFLHSAMKLKGSARTIDVIQIMHQQLIMSRQLADLSIVLSQ